MLWQATCEERLLDRGDTVLVSKLKGIYVLITKNPQGRVVHVGALGAIFFAKGFYAYVGSALNGIESRIKRHLRHNKRCFWHIDYLLKQSRITSVIVSKTDRKLECKIAANLAQRFPSIVRFGSSDCRCRSHLYFERDEGLLKDGTVEALRREGLKWYISGGLEFRSLARNKGFHLQLDEFHQA
jgi:Uri superfamily endonuclease